MYDFNKSVCILSCKNVNTKIVSVVSLNVHEPARRSTFGKMSSLLKTNMKTLKFQNIQPKYFVSNGTAYVINKGSLTPNIVINNKLFLENLNNMPGQTQMLSNITGSEKVIKILDNTNAAKMAGNNHADNIIQKLSEAKSANQITKSCVNQTKKKMIDRKKVGQGRSLLIPREYYPDKTRRKVPMKKVLLQHKHHYRVVGTTNKRKRTIPVKEVEPPPSPIVPADLESELTLPELVRIADAQGLDDEDFMEILTCPSPVWWEEWSDDEEELRFNLKDISEEATSLQQKVLLKELDQKANSNAHDGAGNVNKTEKNNKNYSKKFSDKRTKLEKLLTNIKFKCTKFDKINHEIKQCNELDNNETKDETEVDNEQNVDLNKKNRKLSVSGLSDVSISDELINTLENIEIPVKETTDIANFENKPVIHETANEVSSTDNKVVAKRRKRASNNNKDVVNNYEFLQKRTRKPNRKYEMDWSPEKKNRIKNEVPKTKTAAIVNNETKKSKSPSSTNKNLVKDENEHLKAIGLKKVEDVNIIRVSKPNKSTPKSMILNFPPDFPTLMINPFKNNPKVYASPKSMGNLVTESNDEEDSISDTNIKFLDEYNDKTLSEEEVNVNTYKKGSEGELVTVYQIVTNKDSNFDDIESQIKVNLVNKPLKPEPVINNSQINAFYKTRKRIRNKKK